MSAGAASSRLFSVAVGLGLALATSNASAQDLKLTGLGGQTVTLAPADIAAMPHVTLVVAIDGKPSAYQGVLLTALLARVGAPSGKALRGKDLADVVIVLARDGYTVVLGLAETDPMVRQDQIILADREGGQALTEASGPYRLVVGGDPRGARSAKMVIAIELRRLTASAARPPAP
jgi:hypothetical protein